MEYRRVEEIMAEFGAGGKENDIYFVWDILIRVDAEWRKTRDKLDGIESAADDHL